MLIVRQCWLLFFYSGIGLPFAGVYSIKYEDDSNKTVQSRQLQSGFFPSDVNQNTNYYDNNANYNGNYDGNNLNYNGNSGNYNGNSGNYNSNYNQNTNYDLNSNSQYQGGNTLQFPNNDNPSTNSQPLNVQVQQDNSVFNTGEYYNVDQPQQFSNNDVQYFAYQDPQLSTFANNKRPVTSYYQPSQAFQPNLQNPPPPQRVTQRPIGPFQRPQRPQRPLGPVNNIPQPSGHYQQNYAGNFNNYQTTSNPISNFISNIGQGASDFFNGGSNSNYFSGPPNGPPQQFDSFNRPIRPNGGRPPPGGQGPFGTIEQLGKAIDEITRNDDFQCIPKVICQMFGSQRQQSSYSSILGSPIFSGLIAAVPSSSTGLVYGRAALLGYSSGEHTCNGAYPKCPKNEDDLLYYLNNHRGGFFRFFNGGATFGDDTNYNYQHNNQQNHYQNQNNQYNQNYNQQQAAPQQSGLGNLAALQNLADAINQSDGINLSNLASNGGLLSNLAGLVGGGTGGGNGAADLLSLIGGGAASDASGGGASGILNSLISGVNGGASATQASDANNIGPISLLAGLAQNNGGSTANIGSVVGNLLTGFIGNRFSSRKISKRSVTEGDIGIANEDGKSNEKVGGNSTDELSDVEPRIMNGKLPILSALNEPSNSNSIKFTDENENVYRDGKQIKFDENDVNDESKKSFFIFPSNDIGKQNENVIFPASNDAFRTSKKIKFQQTDSDSHFFPANGDDPHQSLNEINDTPPYHRIKMVFPDRTGTGNLIFDNKEFDTDSTRIGRILTGLRVLQRLEQIQQLNGNTNRILFDATSNGNRYESNSNINANPLYSLAQSNSEPLSNRYTTNQQANNHRFGNQNYNINYNSQSSYGAGGGGGGRYGGDDDASQNVYVTNGQGVVEYYINKAGVKVYV
ncbi:probable cyclin-dependent serine/threonine-protein kinase DDB_G0292550 [Bradysia coprophila]|uniref:probable cyclin-dependent serine/threonine-protein kinase DDB_G0292550 n=1 Tax=Bradysia coprophila TaxID=38358 RepID=UPI00187D9BD1|nr:probable cyclin-dependent serine/threonine-protein kinase DDB_G0292550 [Bradysia coprophila]